MASDRRLHPASFLFILGSQARQMLVPGVALLFTARTADAGWQVVAMVLFVPFALIAVVRALVFRYQVDDDELVIRSGVIFRSVRHVPYNRIHNIDAVQNVLHRLLGVAEVRIETGGGAEPEAAIQVVSMSAFQQLRQHVLARRAPAVLTAEPEASAGPETEVILRLSPGELLLSGFIQNRAAFVVAAAFGLMWEFGLAESAMERVFGRDMPGRGVARQLLIAMIGRAEFPFGAILLGLGGFAVLLLVLRLLSMVWALVTLYGYTLVRQGTDLRAEFGLLTRVTTTTPLRRVQTLTVQESVLHRRFGRVMVRVQTAGTTGGEGQGPRGEAIAPILPRAHLQAFVNGVLPGTTLEQVDWQPPHPRALRRAFVVTLVSMMVFSSWLALWLQWRWFGLVPVLALWAFVHARKYVANLWWGTTDTAVLFRSGWLRRYTTVVHFARVQTVSLLESPFDRRHGMAGVHVDTFGASGAAHRVDIPYMPREAADGLLKFLAAQAAGTRFKV
ncbi:MAG: PH domain-containing protein [Acidobacteria bacterium]|nr:PH domain-containing protein [Acidobacteriota bacterium]